MKQQDLFAHFQACKKVSNPLKKAPPSCPNPFMSTPKRQPGLFFHLSFITFLKVPENYSKTFQKSKASIRLQADTTPILSLSTTELLAQLKAKPIVTSSSGNIGQLGLIQNSSSLREKYKELLKDKIELILPVEYKRLLKIFIVIEEAVQMCTMRNETSWSSLIGEYLLRNCAIKFEVMKLQQILAVMANAYKVKWGMNDKTGNVDLIITIEGEDNNTKVLSEERKKQFKMALYNIVKSHHSEFLKTLPQSESNQFTEECWHPKFDVHNVPDIPLAALPERNVRGQSKHYQSVVDFIKANEIKNAKVKQILEQNVKGIENKENKNEQNDKSVQQQKSLGLSDALIAKIKEKERLLNQSKQLMATSNQFQISDKERLKNVASILKNYAQLRKVSNIFYVQVIDHIASSNKQYLMGKESISQIIDKLITICPNWLQIINHSQGKILRIEKSQDISQILQLIEQQK